MAMPRPLAQITLLAAAYLVSAGLAPAQDQPPKAVSAEVKVELKKLEGTWEPTRYTTGGQSTSAEILGEIRRVAEGDFVYWTRKRKRFAGTHVTLDPSRKLKTIDVVADGGKYRDKVVQGIYKLDGDELTICMAAPDGTRPDSFEAEAGDGRTLMVFRKATAKGDEPKKP
jgi:uncharacterized protein (TIGR03067 family)